MNKIENILVERNKDRHIQLFQDTIEVPLLLEHDWESRIGTAALSCELYATCGPNGPVETFWEIKAVLKTIDSVDLEDYIFCFPSIGYIKRDEPEKSEILEVSIHKSQNMDFTILSLNDQLIACTSKK